MTEVKVVTAVTEMTVVTVVTLVTVVRVVTVVTVVTVSACKVVNLDVSNLNNTHVETLSSEKNKDNDSKDRLKIMR